MERPKVGSCAVVLKAELVDVSHDRREASARVFRAVFHVLSLVERPVPSRTSEVGQDTEVGAYAEVAIAPLNSAVAARSE